MKLYGTLTSERASKSQGGNQYLEIRIVCGSRADQHLLARLTARPDETGYGLYDHRDKRIAHVSDEQIKGNKQKDENA